MSIKSTSSTKLFRVTFLDTLANRKTFLELNFPGIRYSDPQGFSCRGPNRNQGSTGRKGDEVRFVLFDDLTLGA